MHDVQPAAGNCRGRGGDVPQGDERPGALPGGGGRGRGAAVVVLVKGAQNAAQ